MTVLEFDAVRAAASGNWPHILASLGVETKYLRDRHGPCPGCGGRDRFRFDDREGRGTFYCGQGGGGLSGDGFALLQHVHGWELKAAFVEVTNYLRIQPSTLKPVKPKRSTKTYALELWLRADGDVSTHPYAVAKGIDWHAGARRGRASGRIVGKDADCVLVPIRDLATEKIQGVQCINSAGAKQTFGNVAGNAFICGNTLDRSIRWFVCEGWADAISLVFHHYHGNAVALASCGKSMMDGVAKRAAEVFHPERLIVLEDAA